MLDEVRKSGIKIPEPTPEEKETFEKMKELIEEIKGTGLMDSDTDDLASARFAPESTMTDGTPESTMEVARIPINAPPIVAQHAVIECPPDDPTNPSPPIYPPEICDPPLEIDVNSSIVDMDMVFA